MPIAPLRRLVLATTLALAGAWGTEVAEQDLPYAHDGIRLTAAVARPAAATTLRPVVLVVHEWWGLNAYARQRARELATLGYLAVAIDMYGDHQVTEDPRQAGAWAGPFYQSRDHLLARARAGLVAALALPDANRTRVAAIGFCFGGMVCLELARAGDPLAAVVALHPSLKPIGDAATAGSVRARVLVLHGGADPLVPPADVAAFMGEMTAAGAAWRLVAYGGALHAFTNPAADRLHATLPVVGYQAEGAAAALDATRTWLADALH